MISAENIRAIRKQLGMTQEALATKMGVAPMTIRRWEAGKARISHLAERELNRLIRKNGGNNDELTN